MKCLRLLTVIIGLAPRLLSSAESAQLGKEALHRWLAAQTNLTTWSAAFRQTRHLKAFTEPLVSTGRVWFAAPSSFRWELGGAMPQSIAIGSGERLTLLYPRLKRAEIYDMAGGGERNQWKDSLSLLKVGFPRSPEELWSQFRALGVAAEAEAVVVGLEPKAALTRRWIPEIKLTIGPRSELLATELVFSDGSRLRNDFSDARPNLELDPGLFEGKPPEGFKATSPLRP